MSSTGSVVFQNVRKVFGSFTAIHDLSLTIEPGTLVTLLGPSGCGKTTTLRMLAGLEHPTSGRILIGGKDVTKLPANERDVSMVFQSYALFPHMTAAQNVAYGLASSGLKPKEAVEKAEEGLRLVGLAGLGDRLRARARAAGAAPRRATLQSRRAPPPAGAHRDPRPATAARLHRRLRHP
jgi:iron(III) transport system ATP-binding protein